MIKFENVSKLYDPNIVGLDDVNIHIERGEFCFLVGHSGSGKSTFIRLLLKEFEPTEGTITVAGRNLQRMRRSAMPYHRRNLGCVFQDFKLLPNKTVADNVAYALRVTGQPVRNIRRKVPEILNLVGLGDKMNNLPDELSAGEQQRVSVARAFVNHPSLLVADEPTGNLDPRLAAEIMNVFEDINRLGTSVLIASHDLGLIARMRHRMLTLQRGRLIGDGEAS